MGWHRGVLASLGWWGIACGGESGPPQGDEIGTAAPTSEGTATPTTSESSGAPTSAADTAVDAGALRATAAIAIADAFVDGYRRAEAERMLTLVHLLGGVTAPGGSQRPQGGQRADRGWPARWPGDGQPQGRSGAIPPTS